MRELKHCGCSKCHSMASGQQLQSDADALHRTNGRTGVVRCFREISSAILADQGGADANSESRKQLVRRFAAAVLVDQMQARLVKGEGLNVQRHALLVCSMARVAQQIGVNRIPRNITPSPSEYIQQNYGTHRKAAE